MFEGLREGVADRERAVWWLLFAAVCLLLAATVYSFVGTFVLGLFVYYAARPVHRRVREHVDQPTLAVLTTLLLVDLPVFGVFLYVSFLSVREFESVSGVSADLLGRVLFGSSSRGEAFLDAPVRFVTGLDDATLWEGLTTGAGVVGAAGTAVVHVALAFAIAAYLLRDGPRLRGWVASSLEGDPSGPLWTFLRLVDRDLKVVYFGNIRTVVAVSLLGVVVYTGLDAVAPAPLSVPVPMLLAVTTGVATLVPLVVGKLVYVPVTVYLAAEASQADPALLWFPAVVAGVAFALLDLFPITVLRPYLAGRTTHRGLMMFAYIFGVLLFGWYGVFLGPFLLVVTVNLGRVALVDLVQGEPVTYERAAQPLASGRSDAGVETDGDVGATGGPGDVDGTDGS